MDIGVALSKTDGDAKKLAELCRAFDDSFAQPPQQPNLAVMRLVAVRVGHKPIAMQESQIAGLAKIKRIVPLPSRMPELLGIAGNGGMLVPVFSLARLLEIESSSDAHWLALAKSDAAVGLAFDELDGQVEVAPSDIYPEDEKVVSSRMLVRIGREVRRLLDVVRVVEEIKRKAGLTGSAGRRL